MSAPFRTGDVVRHKPTGETWTVAFGDEYGIVCCGWPESWADNSECELIESATDEEHRQLVKKIAESRSDSRRARSCFYLLEQWRITECNAMMHL